MSHACPRDVAPHPASPRAGLTTGLIIRIAENSPRNRVRSAPATSPPPGLPPFPEHWSHLAKPVKLHPPGPPPRLARRGEREPRRMRPLSRSPFLAGRGRGPGGRSSLRGRRPVEMRPVLRERGEARRGASCSRDPAMRPMVGRFRGKGPRTGGHTGGGALRGCLERSERSVTYRMGMKSTNPRVFEKTRQPRRSSAPRSGAGGGRVRCPRRRGRGRWRGSIVSSRCRQRQGSCSG